MAAAVGGLALLPSLPIGSDPRKFTVIANADGSLNYKQTPGCLSYIFCCICCPHCATQEMLIHARGIDLFEDGLHKRYSPSAVKTAQFKSRIDLHSLKTNKEPLLVCDANMLERYTEHAYGEEVEKLHFYYYVLQCNGGTWNKYPYTDEPCKVTLDSIKFCIKSLPLTPKPDPRKIDAMVVDICHTLKTHKDITICQRDHAIIVHLTSEGFHVIPPSTLNILVGMDEQSLWTHFSHDERIIGVAFFQYRFILENIFGHEAFTIAVSDWHDPFDTRTSLDRSEASRLFRKLQVFFSRRDLWFSALVGRVGEIVIARMILGLSGFSDSDLRRDTHFTPEELETLHNLEKSVIEKSKQIDWYAVVLYLRMYLFMYEIEAPISIDSKAERGEVARKEEAEFMRAFSIEEIKKILSDLPYLITTDSNQIPGTPNDEIIHAIASIAMRSLNHREVSEKTMMEVLAMAIFQYEAGVRKDELSEVRKDRGILPKPKILAALTKFLSQNRLPGTVSSEKTSYDKFVNMVRCKDIQNWIPQDLATLYHCTKSRHSRSATRSHPTAVLRAKPSSQALATEPATSSAWASTHRLSSPSGHVPSSPSRPMALPSSSDGSSSSTHMPPSSLHSLEVQPSSTVPLSSSARARMSPYAV